MVVVTGCGTEPSGVRGSVPDRLAVPDDWYVDSLAWNPSGSVVAVLADSGAEMLGRVFLAGSGLEPVTPEDFDVTGFAWLPSGESLLAAVEIFDRADADATAHSELVEFDTGGRVIRRIIPKRPLLLRYGLAVDPTGTFAVAAGGPPGPHGSDFDAQLYEIDLSSGAIEDIPNPPDAHLSSPQFVGPDSVVAFADGTHVTTSNDRDHLAQTMLGDHTTRRITPIDLRVQYHAIVPGTDTVVYRAWDAADRETRHRLWRQSLAADTPTMVPGMGGVRQLAVHPDGQQIVYLHAGPAASRFWIEFDRL